jgi:hypothetical protein
MEETADSHGLSPPKGHNSSVERRPGYLGRRITVAGQRRDLTGLRSIQTPGYFRGTHNDTRPPQSTASAVSFPHEDRRCSHRHPWNRDRRRSKDEAIPCTASTARRVLGTNGFDPAMRIAIDGTDEIAGRTARVLFAERSVSHIGFMQSGMPRLGKRTTEADDLETYDVILSTGETAVTDLLARASVLGVPLVLWHDEPDLHRGPSTMPVVASANVGSALAPSLVHHPSAGVTRSDTITIAWTEPGRPLRKGEAVTFPDPVGHVWAKERGDGNLVARTADDWSGAVATVRGPGGERIVGISDLGTHLEALTLASVSLLTAGGIYGPTIGDASERGAELLAKAMEMELDVAVWRSSL